LSNFNRSVVRRYIFNVNISFLKVVCTVIGYSHYFGQTLYASQHLIKLLQPTAIGATTVGPGGNWSPNF